MRRKLILRCGLAAGDIVMLTAAVRDLHHWYPGRFLTDVRTFYPELWENNPYITPLREDEPKAEQLDCSYPLINSCNQVPYHCLHGFIEFLNHRLGLAVQLTAAKGDIHLSEREKSWYSQVLESTGSDTPFWIVVAGGKHDVTIKWWETERYQKVVDHYRGRIQFVQVGARGDHHPKLEGAIDFRGATNLRELIRLVYHAQGVLCSVTLAMHLAAAVERKPRGPRVRPCVVVAGGREPAHWEAYPGHQFIHSNGALDCCRAGGCWKDRTSPLRDGDPRDRKQCLCPNVAGELPRCMDLITPEEVIRRIELYYRGGILREMSPRQRQAAERGVQATRVNDYEREPLNLHSAGLACDRFTRSIPPCPADLSGRGIVICGGGMRYFTNAWVCINMLRRWGCSLPIQLWHLGRRELEPWLEQLVRPLGVECVDALRMRRQRPARVLRGWVLKPYAMLHSSFREVLVLDADNVPVRNPESLFELPEFRATGAVFWPDDSEAPNRKAAAIWRSCGLRIPREPEFESGQILVDKSRCWGALRLSLWFNEHCDFYYQFVHGDKETFHLAFRKLKQGYSLVPRPTLRLEGALCQHDFEGRRIFQHRNGRKWSLHSRQERIEGFWHEDDCRKYVAELRKRWEARTDRTGRSAPALWAAGRQV